MICPACGRPSPTERRTCPRRYHPDCLAADVRRRKRERYRSGGSRHGNTNLTETDVIEIRAAYAAGARCIDLARQRNMTPSGMHAILSYRTWRHVP